MQHANDWHARYFDNSEIRLYWRHVKDFSLEQDDIPAHSMYKCSPRIRSHNHHGVKYLPFSLPIRSIFHCCLLFLRHQF